MLRRASEAAGLAEAELHPHSHLLPDRSGATSPDNGTTCHDSPLQCPPQSKAPADVFIFAFWMHPEVFIVECQD